MEKPIYFYPTAVKLFLGVLPLGITIFTCFAMLLLLLYFLIAKHIPIPIFISFSLFILFVIYLCIFGLVCLGPVITEKDYLKYNFLKVGWSDIVSIKEIDIQGNKRILIVKTKSLNPLFKFILVSSLITNYEALKTTMEHHLGK